MTTKQKTDIQTPSRTDINAYRKHEELVRLVAKLRHERAVAFFLDSIAGTGESGQFAQSALFGAEHSSRLAGAEALLKAVEQSEDFRDSISRAEPYIRQQRAEEARRRTEEQAEQERKHEARRIIAEAEAKIRTAVEKQLADDPVLKHAREIVGT